MRARGRDEGEGRYGAVLTSVEKIDKKKGGCCVTLVGSVPRICWHMETT